MFFQVPDMSRVLRDLAFWDIYYEHCSYFTVITQAVLSGVVLKSSRRPPSMTINISPSRRSRRR